MSSIHNVDHINIVVSDLDKSVDFYTRLLGFEKIREAYLEGEWIGRIAGLDHVSADVVYVQPPGGGPRIELIQYHAPRGAQRPECALANTVGLRHIALRVDNIERMYARLQAAGVEFLSEPVPVPTGVVHHDAGDKSLCYFRDPDGVILELAAYE